MKSELVPGVSVAVRLGALQGVRVAAAALAMAVLVARQEVSIAPAAVILGWALLTTAHETVRRMRRAPARGVGALLVIDAVVMALAAHATGGPRSPMLAVAYLHVLLAASLLSTLTGLRLAILHATALYVAHALATAQSTVRPPAGLAATHAVGYLLVAGGAALCGQLQARASERGRAELHALAHLGPRLAAASSAAQVAADLAAAVVADFGFARVRVLHQTGSGWRSTSEDGAVATFEEALGQDPALSEALRCPRPMTLRRLPVDSSLNQLIAAARDVVIVGVEAEPSLAVVAEWDTSRGRPLRAETLVALTEAANHAALAIAATKLRDELHRMATHDGLTALVNRATFDRRLAEALADRRSQPVSVALVDLDHFKAVNDVHGHQVGDEVLRRTADAIRAVARPGDITARYGGEELVVVLPRCSAAEAARVAERLRQQIAASGVDPVVTASIGVATGCHGSSPDDVLSAADEALYKAKRQGRDRVVVASNPSPARGSIDRPLRAARRRATQLEAARR